MKASPAQSIAKPLVSEDTIVSSSLTQPIQGQAHPHKCWVYNEVITLYQSLFSSYILTGSLGSAIGSLAEYLIIFQVL